MTQCEMIKMYMDMYGSITALDAMKEFGVMRLASRMADLKADGYKFYTVTVKGTNRFGQPTCYAKYVKGEKDVHQMR